MLVAVVLWFGEAQDVDAGVSPSSERVFQAPVKINYPFSLTLALPIFNVGILTVVARTTMGQLCMD
jgi:hypothetical protein